MHPRLHYTISDQLDTVAVVEAIYTWNELLILLPTDFQLTNVLLCIP